MHAFLTSYWVRWVGQSKFKWNTHYLQDKQF